MDRDENKRRKRYDLKNYFAVFIILWTNIAGLHLYLFYYNNVYFG